MHHPTDRIAHTTAFVTPVVEHWLEREIAQRVHPMSVPLHVLAPYIYIYIAYKQQNTTQKTNTNQIHHTNQQATTPTSMAHIYLITGIETTVSLYIDIAPIGAGGGWRADPPPPPLPPHTNIPQTI